MRLQTLSAIFVLFCCQEVSMKLGRSSLMNRLLEVGVKPVGRQMSSLPPETNGFQAGPSGRRHMDCAPRTFPEDETPVLIELPKHIDDNMYYVTTTRPYFTAGPIAAQGYHPPSPTPPDSCERIYQDFVQKQYSDSESELSTSQESIEFIRIPIDKVE